MKTSEMLNVGAGFHPCPEKGKNVSGITLVALIITIIIMLILVGVSIQVVINSDLIGTTQNAADRTETAYEQEGNISEVTIGNKIYSSIEDYINSDGGLVSDGSWDKGVNTPKLEEGMTPIAWDEDGEPFTPTTNEEWYDYVNQAEGVDGTSRQGDVLFVYRFSS